MTSLPELSDSRRIPPPDPDLEPLKVNVYERMSKAAAQLMPLFPYVHTGAIVPCGNVLIGGPGRAYGQFFHWNTVSEVVVCYGSNNSPLAPAQIIATQNLHGVNSRLDNEKDPEAYAVIVVTQHQAEEGDQSEALITRCKKCKEELTRHEYDATPPSGTTLAVHQFATTVGSADFARQHNTERGRTCANCGHVNNAVPGDVWGWERQVRQTDAVNSARAALVGAQS
ncbi:hypothetical protein [Spirillospora sp. NPDC048819]|uniref:hypothetical protein n=1 Tax=Spirillospora sp. NPDC048819 TaxID=3155268 RepID=UPI0033E16374